MAIGAFVALLRGFDLADGGTPSACRMAASERFSRGIALGVRDDLGLPVLGRSASALLQSTGVTAEQLAKFEDGTILAIEPGPAAGTFMCARSPPTPMRSNSVSNW